MAELSPDEKDAIEGIAELFTKDLLDKTGLNTIKDPFNKIPQLNQAIENLILIRFPSKHDMLSGFSYKVDKYKCVYINSGHSLGRQYCSFWHEIYHVIDDSSEININYEGEDDLGEERAKYYSYCVLLPKKDITNYVIGLSKKPTSLSIEEIIKMQFYFRTSLDALVFRLVTIYNSNYFFKFREYSRIDKVEEYQNIVKGLGFGTDLIVPTNDYIVPKEFFKDVHDNLYNKRISFEKVQELLEIIEEKGIEGLW